jgi:hypothetical protein
MRAGARAGTVLRFLAAAVLVVTGLQQSTSCWATSRVGDAQVTEAAGQPCFAISDEAETRGAAARLFSISVSETLSPNWQTLPAELWAFTVDPPGRSIDARPDRCIRYGDLPASARPRQQPRPLGHYRVYVVEINARPAGDTSPTRGYKAEFCIKPAPGGRVAVQTVPWDAAGKRRHYEVCKPP